LRRLIGQIPASERFFFGGRQATTALCGLSEQPGVPWSDEALLERVRHSVLPMMKRNGPIVAWIVDDTGFPQKGTHSVGVVRQYCGQVGKQENCRVAVSLSLTTEQASLPIAWRLYLPETWAQDRKRRKETGIPQEVPFATKPGIALQ
jgi:SRSO17 transposase